MPLTGTNLWSKRWGLFLGVLLLSACGSGGGSNEGDTVRLDHSSGNHFRISGIADVDLTPNAVRSVSTRTGVPVDTSAGIRVFASDEDRSGNEVSYSLVDDAGGRFAIDSELGVVRTAMVLFFSTTIPGYTIQVRAESEDGSMSMASFFIAVLPPNLFPVSPIMNTDTAPAARILESAPAGTPVGVTVAAQDMDTHGNEVRYSLLDDAGGLFVIDPISGVISLRSSGVLDVRTSSEHVVVVQAMSEDGSTSMASFTIEVRPALVLNIYFPAPGSLAHVDATTMSVSGGVRPAVGGSTLSALVVSDGTGSWPVTLPVPPAEDWQVEIPFSGPTTLTVTATDSEGLSVSRVLWVDQEVAPQITFSAPLGLVLDADNNRILVADNGLKAVVALDISGDCSYDSTAEDPPESGCLISIISDDETGSGDIFDTLSGGIALDATRGRVLVVAEVPAAVLAVDLASGDRSTLAACSDFDEPNGIMIDAGRNRAVVSNSIPGGTDDQLIAIDLDSGACTELSGPAVGGGPSLGVPNKIAAGPGDTVLVPDSSNPDTLFSVNLESGTRTVVSGGADGMGSGDVFQTPRAVVLDALTDPANPRALVRDDSTRACGIIAVDLQSGDRSYFSVRGTNTRCPAMVGDGPVISGSGSLIIDTLSTPPRLLVADEDLGAIVVIDLATGNRQQLHPETPGPPPILIGSGPRLSDPLGLALDPMNNLLYVADNGLDAVLELNLGDRSRMILSSAVMESMVGEGPAFGIPRGLVLDAENNRILVIDSETDTLYAVDLVSGERTALSNNEIDSTPPTFGSPRGSMALEDAMTVLVADTARDSLFRVDLVSGERTALATASNAELEGIQNVVLDRAGSRALVSVSSAATASVLDGIIAVSLADGMLTPVSTPRTGSGTIMTNPRGIALDTANSRLLVLDADLGILFAVDLASGDREILSEGAYLVLAGSNALVLDAARNLVYAVQEGLPEVIMIDLASGVQVVIGN